MNKNYYLCESFYCELLMPIRWNLYIVVLILLLPALQAGAIERTDSGMRAASSFLALEVRPAYAFSSYKDDVLKENLIMTGAKKTRVATSAHLKYGFSFPENSSYGRICPQAWQGIGAAVNFLGNDKGIGTPVSVYVFQGAPIWTFNDRLSAYYEWNFGASFGWKPCDGETAYTNLIVGSRVNAYINLGIGLQWRVGKQYALSAGLDLTHFSNGNTSYPNPGVNMAGVKIGVSRYFGRSPRPERSVPDTVQFRRGLGFDVTAYVAYRKRVYRGDDDPVLLNGRFGVAGLNLAPMWRISRNFRTGPSLDLQWDESTDLRRHHVSGTTAETILFTRPSFFSQVSTGISGRAELVMPLFSVNVGFGYNFIGPEETRTTYQLANLKVNLVKGLYLNIGYQLQDFQKQSNLMLGLGYSFH